MLPILPSSRPPYGATEVHARPRSFEIPGWARKNNLQRIKLISRIGRDAASDPRMRRLAVSIFRAARVPPKDYAGQAAAVLAVMNAKVYFVNEGDGRGAGEVIQDPAYTLDLQADGTIGPRAAGDCDDHASAAMAILESVHLPTRLVTSGRVGHRRIRYVEGVGSSPAGAKFSHMYLTVGLRPFHQAYDPRTWVFFDSTVPGVPLGWDCVSQGASDPQAHSGYAGVELGDADPPGDGLSLKTAAGLVFVSILSAVIVTRLQRAGWI